MGAILNFSKWKRIYEQTEAEENNIKSEKKGDLNVTNAPDLGNVTISMRGITNGDIFASLQFYNDKIDVSRSDTGNQDLNTYEKLTPSKALQSFFSAANLIGGPDQRYLFPKAKELATLILNNTDLESSPKSLIHMFQQLMNSEGNILKGTFEYFPLANRAMAEAVKEFKESSPDKFKKWQDSPYSPKYLK